MLPLTIHLLVQNHKETIRLALESLQTIDAHVVIADAGCTDESMSICKSFGYPIRRVSALYDRSHARNELIKSINTPWHMYMEPYEVLLAGSEILSNIVTDGPRCYHCEIIQGDVITKQVRIWHKDTNKQFINPIYESIKDDASSYAGVIFCREMGPQFDLSKIEEWKKKYILATDPYYFQAFACLANHKYQDFLNLAEYYLFHEKKQTVSAIMTRYYMGVVQCLVYKDYPQSIRNAITCMSACPLMAEFWCLLGDIFFAAKQPDKSQVFYENAIILGRKRFREDRWPMQISKYEEYPQEMIDKCKKINENTIQMRQK